MGDINEELSPNIKNHTGRYTRSDQGSRNAGKIIDIMRAHDLCAVNTRFKKSKSPATYLQANTIEDPAGRFVGRSVCVKWKNKEILGKVKQQINDTRWKIKFEDDYEKIANEQELQDMLILNQGEKMQGKKLDYIMVSNRWATSVKDSNVRWGPSEHRNIYGRADHALVDCEVKWRIRSPKPTLKKDFSVLFASQNENRGLELSPEDQARQDKCMEHQAAFEQALESKEKEINENKDTEEEESIEDLS